MELPTVRSADFAISREVLTLPTSGISSTRPPQARTSRAPDDSVLGIVAALHQNIGTDGFDQPQRRVFVEDDDRINRAERGQHPRAFLFRRRSAAAGLSAGEPSRRC